METIPTANIQQLAKILYANILAGIPTGILGGPGIGKTAIMLAIYNKLADRFSGGVFVIATTEYNVLDLGGLYQVVDGLTVRCPSDQIPFDKPVLILVDEFADCPAHEQSSYYRLVKEQVIGTRQLAAGSYVAFAANRPEDNAAAREISTAMKGRAMLITLAADYLCTLLFARRNNWDSRIISFIKAFGSEVVNNGFDADCPYAGSTPRDFERLAALESAGLINADIEIANLQIVGCIGPDAGARYAAFRAIETPDPALVFDTDDAPVFDRHDIEKACLYGSAIVGYCQESEPHFQAIANYCLRCDRVTGFSLFFDIVARYPAFKSSPAMARLVERFGPLFI